jgi:hypothetical protein
VVVEFFAGVAGESPPPCAVGVVVGGCVCHGAVFPIVALPVIV